MTEEQDRIGAMLEPVQKLLSHMNASNDDVIKMTAIMLSSALVKDAAMGNGTTQMPAVLGWIERNVLDFALLTMEATEQ